MSLKRPLLITVALIGTATTVHSQSTNPNAVMAPRPAALFGDAPAPAQARPAPTSLPVSPDGQTAAAAPARRGQVQPFVLDIPKPAPAPAGEDDQAPRAAEVDLSALRYFASQNDLARVAAEIRLLRAKNPGWEPPEDLFSDVRGGEAEKPLWDLFAKHDMDGLKAAMEQMRQDKPDWQPSSDLQNKLNMAEARDALVQASDAQQWGAVLEVAAANQMLMTCGDIDALWRTAEALVRTGDEARAIEAYRYVLTSCSKPAERLATVQKASVLLSSPDSLDPLLALGRRLPNGRSEFESVRLDLVRRKIGDTAAGKPGPAPTPAEIEAVTAHAKTTHDLDDAQLLGWYSYSLKDAAQAETWFRTVLQLSPNAKAAEGLVLALRAEGKISEAQKSAEAYAALDPLNRKLMVEVLCAALDDPKATALTADETTALAKAIEDEKSSDGAQAFGWHLYRTNDVAGAAKYFGMSADWQANESAAIGLLVTAKRMKNEREYAAIIAKYKATYSKIADLDSLMRPHGQFATAAYSKRSGTLSRVAIKGHAPKQTTGGGDRGWDGSADAIVKTYENGNYDQAMAMLEQRRQQRGSEPGGLSVVRGWAMYHKGDWEGAKQVFSGLQNTNLQREAQEGSRVIQLGYTNPRYR